MRKYLRFVPLAVVMLAAIAASRNAAAQAGSFDPCANYGPLQTAAPNVPSAVTLNFGLGVGLDCVRNTSDDDPVQYLHDSLTTFFPAQWGVAEDLDVPDGRVVGTYISNTGLGVFNNGCSNVVSVNYTLREATTNRVNPLVVPPSNLLLAAQDSDADGISNGAERWPDYLEQIGARRGWDLDRVRARLIGVNSSLGLNIVIIMNVLVFEPGTQISPEFDTDPALGYPVAVVQYPQFNGAAVEQVLSDFCSPLSARLTFTGATTFGDVFRTNPTDGVYPFTTLVTSTRDADDDGIENTLDTCPYTATPAWNPRAFGLSSPGDPDGDGLPDQCDPNPAVRSAGTAGTGGADTDEDADAWQNRGDNCPLTPNVSQADGDFDGIGDTCDQSPETPDGSSTLRCIVSEVVIGDGVGAGPPPANPLTLRPCDPGATFPSAGSPVGGAVALATSDVAPSSVSGWSIAISATTLVASTLVLRWLKKTR